MISTNSAIGKCMSMYVYGQGKGGWVKKKHKLLLLDQAQERLAFIAPRYATSALTMYSIVMVAPLLVCVVANEVIR